MPAFLSGFSYDVFISYGWAGAENPDEGDRGWVNRFQQELTREVSGHLGQLCSVFFDDYAGRAGYLYKNLDDALQNSAAFLYMVSPGSCRPDSWCRYELRQFLDLAQPIAHPTLPRDTRLCKPQFRKIDGPVPDPLSKCVPYTFFEDRFGNPIPVAELQHLGSKAYREFQQLCLDLANLLKRARDLQQHTRPFSGKTVFLGSVPPELTERRDRLLNNLENQGHRVLLATPFEGEDPAAFARRTDDAVARASVSVHLFGTPQLDLASALQCRAALHGSGRVYLWRDRDVHFDPAHEQFLSEIQAAYLNTGRLEFPQGGADSYLDPNLGFDLAPPPPPSPAPPSSTQSGGGKIMLQFFPRDKENIADLWERLHARGLDVRVPLFAGNRREREEIHARFYREADGIVIFFGSANDLWTFNTCSAVSKTLGGELNRKPTALVLAPPPDKPPSKGLFSFPPFQVIDCNHPGWSDQLDHWLEQVAGVAHAH